jgi:hypothetical protein
VEEEGFREKGVGKDLGIARAEAFPAASYSNYQEQSLAGLFLFLDTLHPICRGCAMAYYKVLIEIWCDWDPRKSDLKEIAGHVALREGAICTLQEVIRVVDRPQEIENDAALIFFGGEEGDADESQG